MKEFDKWSQNKVWIRHEWELCEILSCIVCISQRYINVYTSLCCISIKSVGFNVVPCSSACRLRATSVSLIIYFHLHVYTLTGNWKTSSWWKLEIHLTALNEWNNSYFECSFSPIACTCHVCIYFIVTSPLYWVSSIAPLSLIQ
jgi:hypothetical protein